MSKLSKMVGTKMPHFELQDQEEKWIHSASLTGKSNLVVYFYPKDDTPGCTAEACSFRDSFEIFQDYECKVIGISADSPESHQQFAEKHKLPFTLLSDPDNKIRNQFGVPRNLFGLLPGRVTYIIDRNGIIRHVFNAQFQATKHIHESLEALKLIDYDRVK